jgi:predicted anti-sigma-YlaC factor YlaD
MTVKGCDSMKLNCEAICSRMAARPADAVLRCVAFILLLSAGGCSSINRMAVNKLGDALAGGGTTFASDDDPELVRQAVPFSLKIIESLLAENPKHEGLLFAAASGFTQYSYAFVQEEAEELESGNLTKSRELMGRARRLDLRARDYGLRGLEVRHRGFAERLRENPHAAVAPMKKADVPLLYWSAVSWAAAISLSKDDPALVGDLPKVEAMIDRALELDESWDQGSIHAFLIAFEMGRAGGEGDRTVRAKKHFARAVELSRGRLAGPFLSYAESVCVEREDRKQFEHLLGQALAINADDDPPTRLNNLVMQRRARWLLSRTDKLFLPSLDEKR